MRKLLRDLVPAHDYALQFRSVNTDEELSAWSQIFRFRTDGDTQPPAPPSNLTWTTVGSSFLATWTKPTLDGNGEELRDFKDYEITITAGVLSKVVYSLTESFELTLATNKDVFGEIAWTVSITVKSRDQTGNVSPTGVTATATMDAPPVPSTPVVSDLVGQLLVTWDGNPASGVRNPLSLEYVEIHASTTNNFTPSETTLKDRFDGVFPEKQSAIISGFAYGVTVYVKLVAVNRVGRKSAPSAQGSGSAARITGLDIVNGAITTTQINFTARDIGAAKAYYQTTQPTTGMVDGDVWFDTDDGYHARVYSSGTWQEARDTTIAAAQTAANTAQTTANGKNKVTYSTSTPGTTANAAGDIWFQKNVSNVIIGHWEGAGGTTWVAKTIDNAVIANLDAGKITAGTISADRIGALSITGDKIAANAITAVKINAGAVTADAVGTNLIITAAANIADAVIDSAKISSLNAGKITAGVLQSSSTVSYGGGTPRPTWSFDLVGNAQLNDVNVRGQLVIGNSTDTAAVQTASVLRSYNYIANTAGWAIKGDGTVEFSSGTFRGNITGATISGSSITASSFTTATTGRRIFVGTGGASGTMSFIDPSNITRASIISGIATSISGSEMIRIGTTPTSSTIWTGWNGIQVEGGTNSENEIHLISAANSLTVGGDGPETAKGFFVNWAQNRGGPTTPPVELPRIYLDNTSESHYHLPSGQFIIYERTPIAPFTFFPRFNVQQNLTQFWMGVVQDAGNIEMYPGTNNGFYQTSYIKFVTPYISGQNSVYAGIWQYAITLQGGNSGFEARNGFNNGFENIKAAAFNVNSSGRGKTSIKNLEGSAIDKIRTVKAKKFIRKDFEPRTDHRAADADLTEPVRIEETGLVAEDLPPEVLIPGVRGEGPSYSLSGMMALVVQSINEIKDDLEALKTQIKEKK